MSVAEIKNRLLGLAADGDGYIRLHKGYARHSLKVGDEIVVSDNDNAWADHLEMLDILCDSKMIERVIIVSVSSADIFKITSKGREALSA